MHCVYQRGCTELSETKQQNRGVQMSLEWLVLKFHLALSMCSYCLFTFPPGNKNDIICEYLPFDQDLCTDFNSYRLRQCWLKYAKPLYFEN